VSPAPSPAALPKAAEAREIRLSPGLSREAPLRGGESHHYLFSLAQGEYAGLVIEQRGIDVAVSLHAPDGAGLATVERSNDTLGPEPLPVVAGAAGRYRLEVRASDPQAPAGRYALRVEALRAATDRDRTRVRAERLFSAAEDLRRREDRTSLEAAVTRELQALELFRSLGDDWREADVLYRLGWARRSLDENATALGDYRRALDLFRRQGREREVSESLNSIGQLQARLGEPEAALAAYREALALNRRLGERQREVTNLNNLGKVHARLGEVETAFGYYERALSLCRELGDRAREAEILSNLAYLYQGLGEAGRALDHLHRALALYEEQGRLRDAAMTLMSIGSTHGRSGEPRKGLAPMLQALALQRRLGDRRREAVTLNDLGWTHLVLGEPREARRRFAQALALLDQVQAPSTRAQVLTSLAWADVELGRFREAAATFEEALPLLAVMGDRSFEASTLLGLAWARRGMGDLAAAWQAAEGALDRVESLRAEPASPGLRASYLASQQGLYGFCLDLLMEQHRREPAAGYDARALAVSEEARARSFLDVLARAGLRSGADPAGPLLQAREAARPLGLPEIQAEVVDDDSLLLEYALGRERSYLWVVTPGSLASYELPSRAVIEAAARRTHNLLSASHNTLARAETEEALAELSRLLLGPVAGRLARKRLVVVPDGALFYIPFAALPVAGPGGRAEHEVVVLPSASALALMRRRTADRSPASLGVAVVADPVFDAADPRVRSRSSPAAPLFRRLPFSRREAEAVLAFAPPDESLRALDFAANRETLLDGRLERYRILHFATHGVLDAAHPERSGLMLSRVDPQGRPRDGFVRAQEIYRLRLTADLVVLSACHTALGREIRGEGLIGLTRGFQSAGVPRVLVSLWEVDDEAAAELMRRFYRALLAEGLPPAAALRAAQAALRSEPGWDAPYFWAGFVLQGDWRPLPRR
jgi:CHAT domain-containing protein